MGSRGCRLRRRYDLQGGALLHVADNAAGVACHSFRELYPELARLVRRGSEVHRGETTHHVVVAQGTAAVFAPWHEVLETGLDRVPPEPEPRRPMPQYQHLRGPGYCT